MKNFIEEVTWRGMLHDVMPGTEEHLMEQMRVDFGVLTETKLNHTFFTHEANGFSVIATKAKSCSQGGVALFY